MKDLVEALDPCWEHDDLLYAMLDYATGATYFGLHRDAYTHPLTLQKFRDGIEVYRSELKYDPSIPPGFSIALTYEGHEDGVL